MSKYQFKDTPPKRSKNMSKIKSKNTKPELLLRKKLWHSGLKGYRLNKKGVDGTPDIVYLKKKVAIFVDGEFWHGRNWNSKKKRIKTNKNYWLPKIEKNILRDEAVNMKLLYKGWTVLRFWDTDILKNPEIIIDTIRKTLEQQD